MPKEGCPCKGCNDRVADPNCHGTCQRYVDWAKANAEERQKRLDQNMTDYYIRDMKVIGLLKKYGTRRKRGNLGE